MKDSGERDRDLALLLISGATASRRSDLLAGLLRRLAASSVDTLLLARETPTAAILSCLGEKLCCRISNSGFRQGLQGEEARRLLVERARWLAGDHDLVVAEAGDGGGKAAIELLDHVDAGGRPVFRRLAAAAGPALTAGISQWLVEKMAAAPLWSCLLIGGRSSRMGRPKHLLSDASGVSWAERLVDRLGQASGKVVLAGSGDLPAALAGMVRLPDVDGVSGPLAGILAAMRWNPRAAWLVCACDMPFVDRRALDWLLTGRRPGVWGVVPHERRQQRYQPLLACYEGRARQLFEKLAGSGNPRPGAIVGHERIATPDLPVELSDCWRNCNSPEDLDWPQ